MVEYIDREAALVEIDEWADTFCECDYVFPHILKSIRKLPAADVRPVVHGKWIVGKSKWNAGLNSYTCSICGGAFQDVEPTKFCPDCGADMAGAPKEGET